MYVALQAEEGRLKMLGLLADAERWSALVAEMRAQIPGHPHTFRLQLMRHKAGAELWGPSGLLESQPGPVMSCLLFLALADWTRQLHD